MDQTQRVIGTTEGIVIGSTEVRQQADQLRQTPRQTEILRDTQRRQLGQTEFVQGTQGRTVVVGATQVQENPIHWEQTPIQPEVQFTEGHNPVFGSAVVQEQTRGVQQAPAVEVNQFDVQREIKATQELQQTPSDLVLPRADRSTTEFRATENQRTVVAPGKILNLEEKAAGAVIATTPKATQQGRAFRNNTVRRGVRRGVAPSRTAPVTRTANRQSRRKAAAGWWWMLAPLVLIPLLGWMGWQALRGETEAEKADRLKWADKAREANSPGLKLQSERERERQPRQRDVPRVRESVSETRVQGSKVASEDREIEVRGRKTESTRSSERTVSKQPTRELKIASEDRSEIRETEDRKIEVRGRKTESTRSSERTASKQPTRELKIASEDRSEIRETEDREIEARGRKTESTRSSERTASKQPTRELKIASEDRSEIRETETRQNETRNEKAECRHSETKHEQVKLQPREDRSESCGTSCDSQDRNEKRNSSETSPRDNEPRVIRSKDLEAKRQREEKLRSSSAKTSNREQQQSAQRSTEARDEQQQSRKSEIAASAGSLASAGRQRSKDSNRREESNRQESKQQQRSTQQQSRTAVNAERGQQRDDFTQIAGCNARMQEALYSAGYFRFSDLKTAGEGRVTRIFNDANIKFSDSETRRFFRELTERSDRTEAAQRTTASSDRDNSNGASSSGRDDLTRIHGVGTATANYLRNAGFDSFRKIHEAGSERLRLLFASAGPKFKLINPTTSWSRQASFAMNGDWDGLARWQTENSELVAGTETRTQTQLGQQDFASMEPDDLTKIRGIGPASQKLLFKKGIFRFEQIANMSGQELEELFEEYRDRFQLLNPTAWPKQAAKMLQKRAANPSGELEESLLKEIDSLKLPTFEAPQIVNETAGRDQ